MGRNFRANRDLLIPAQYETADGMQGRRVADSRPVKRNDKLSEADLANVYIGGLLQARFLTELEPDPIKCEACADSGSAAEKKKKYANVAELRDHYADAHRHLAPPEGG